MNSFHEGYRRRSKFIIFCLMLFGILLIIVGAIIAYLGYQLFRLHGSGYYLIIGLTWLIAGLLALGGRSAGLYVYALSFVATLIWSLWEAGLNGWALLPRLDLPLLLLLFAVLLMPARRGDGSAGYRRYSIALLILTLMGLAVAVPLAQKRAPAAASTTGPGHYFDEDTAPAAKDWPTYGGGYGAQRFSALTQITRDNIGRLKRAWVYRTGEPYMANVGNELTPIKVGDMLYGCTIRHRIFAVDASTGKQQWMFDPKTPGQSEVHNSPCRGVAYYADPQAQPGQQCAARIIAGTLDAKLVAVDARSGKACQQFGTHGFIDLMQGMGDWPLGVVSVNSAPTLVRGVVVTGHQVLDGQQRFPASGVVRGYDAVTGQLRFAWDMEQPDITKLPPQGHIYSPGTPNMWSTAVGDEKLGLVYLPMANSVGDYVSSLRTTEERKYNSSVTALDVATGKPRWVFQFVKNDVWDYDTPAQPSLVDFPTEKGSVPALIAATKQGDLWVLDRRTGQPLHGVALEKAPQGGVEPNDRAPVQKRSMYNRTQKPDLTEEMMWGISPFDQLLCRIQYRAAHYQGIFTAPSADKSWIQYPGNSGGTDWGSVSVDVLNGVIIENYNDFPSYSRLMPHAAGDVDRAFWRNNPRYAHLSSSPSSRSDLFYDEKINTGWLSKIAVVCKQPPFGMIRGIDLASGKTLWDRPLGTAERNGPWGQHSRLPIEIGLPNNGGPLTTAGGLAFIAATTDNTFRALDVRTGKILWQEKLPAGGQATPMSYAVNGRQFIVIMAGGHSAMKTPQGDFVIAYALSDK